MTAKRYRAARLFGLDISSAMLITAQAKLASAGLGDRVILAQGNATAFDPSTLFGEPRFDRIFFSYTLSMIPQWEAAIEAGLDALQPGGELHIVDFGQQQHLPPWFGLVLRHWLARFDVTPRAELLKHCAKRAHARGLHCSHTELYRDYAWSVTFRSDTRD